jgi:hypothetical protein
MNDAVMRGHMDDEREHMHTDEVPKGSGMDCVKWTEEWWKWLLRLEEERNPIMQVGNPTFERYRAGQPVKGSEQEKCMNDNGESVWFLAAPPYGTNIVRVNIPRGKWSILATPYVAGASDEMFPSKSTEQLKYQIKRDVEGVYELYVTLDGIRVTGCTVKPEHLFEVEVPKNNIFGIDVKGGSKLIKMVQYGYWIWLQPLSAGDHLLHLHGYSKNYQLDVKYQLMVAGGDNPAKKSS